MYLTPESGQAVIVHVIDEWAKVAPDNTGTSEASLPEHLCSGFLTY